MIIKYCFSNFLSFNENVEFSMLAPASKVKKRYTDNYVELENGYDVQKSAVIVGENAGGKTNFVKSLVYFKSLFENNEIIHSMRSSLNERNTQKGCLQTAQIEKTEQTFNIEVTDDVFGVFVYQLIFDCISIKSEKLSYRKEKNKKERIVFEVNRKKIDFNCNCPNKENDDCNNNAKISEIRFTLKENDESIQIIYDKYKENGMEIKNGLFVTQFSILGSEAASRFTKIIMNDICPETAVLNLDFIKSMKKEENDLRIMKDSRFFEIFRIVDYSIKSIEINEEDPFKKTKITREREDGEEFVRQIGQDSSGVKVFFAWAINLFKVIYENKTIIADEMDGVLNPVLSDRIVSFVHGKQHHGQFIFTSHNVLHLDLANYMKEQIYFITKKPETLASEMYSLADFPEVRYETTKIYEFYLKGILGGTASE